LILSFGGVFISDEDADLSNKKVTHNVIDRPLAAGTKLDSTKEYVQP
jgi:hypothetical protein